MTPVTTLVEAKDDYALRIAKASLEIEGQRLPEGGESLIKQNINGEISDSEFLKQALDLAKRV